MYEKLMLVLIASRVILTHEILSHVSSTSGGPRKLNIYCNKARLTYLTRQSSHDKHYTMSRGIKVLNLSIMDFRCTNQSWNIEDQYS